MDRDHSSQIVSELKKIRKALELSNEINSIQLSPIEEHDTVSPKDIKKHRAKKAQEMLKNQ